MTGYLKDYYADIFNRCVCFIKSILGEFSNDFSDDFTNW